LKDADRLHRIVVNFSHYKPNKHRVTSAKFYDSRVGKAALHDFAFAPPGENEGLELRAMSGAIRCDIASALLLTYAPPNS
jgi:hypothetical protein